MFGWKIQFHWQPEHKLEEIEETWQGYMFYINENVPLKTANVKGLPDDSN